MLVLPRQFEIRRGEVDSAEGAGLHGSDTDANLESENYMS